MKHLIKITSFAIILAAAAVVGYGAQEPEPATEKPGQTTAESKNRKVKTTPPTSKETSDPKVIQKSDKTDNSLEAGQSPTGIKKSVKPDVQDVKSKTELFDMKKGFLMPFPDIYNLRKKSSQTKVQSSAADLAKKLANPIASLIQVPYQINYDGKKGATNSGETWSHKIQPVIPIKLNDEWNLISRTIIPMVVFNNDLPTDGISSTGIGDITQEFWFSPSKVGENGIIWGVGPAFVFPTATDGKFGSGKWSIGPTFLILRQKGPLTFGQLTNQFWSFAGDSNRADTNSLFLQPFISYSLKSHMTFTLESESTYNWKAKNWSVPVVFSVKQLFMIGKQPFQIGAGPAYWATSPAGGPEGLGARFYFTAMFQ